MYGRRHWPAVLDRRGGGGWPGSAHDVFDAGRGAVGLLRRRRLGSSGRLWPGLRRRGWIGGGGRCQSWAGAPMIWLGVAATSALGAVGRYGLMAGFEQRFDRGIPWGTAVVNLAGALALGLLVGCRSVQCHRPPGGSRVPRLLYDVLQLDGGGCVHPGNRKPSPPDRDDLVGGGNAGARRGRIRGRRRPCPVVCRSCARSSPTRPRTGWPIAAAGCCGPRTPWKPSRAPSTSAIAISKPTCIGRAMAC